MILREGFFETRPVGNRLLAPGYPGLRVPPLRVTDSFARAALGPEPVFAVHEDGRTKQYSGLAEHLRVETSGRRIYLFDNHNYALAYWLESALDGLIGESGHRLVHVDQHSDLRPNDAVLHTLAELDRHSAFEFAHASCNVGNYIVPALCSGFIGEMTRIESENVLLAHAHDFGDLCHGELLNIDLDFFAPEMNIEKTDLAIGILRQGIATARVVTVATSPYFLDQALALDLIRKILREAPSEAA